MDRAGQHSNYAGQCKANAIEPARFAEPQPVLAILLQRQCKANAIELARFAEPQPVLAFLNAKLGTKKERRKKSSIAVEFLRVLCRVFAFWGSFMRVFEKIRRISESF